jgi:uncharacterized protein YkwD
MKRLWVILLFNFLIAAVFALGAFSAFFSVRTAISWYSVNKFALQVEPFTGKDVLAELNAYRKELGMSNFTLSSPLCNNLVERWQNYKDGNNHEGLDEFAAREMPGIQVAEIITTARSAKATVDNWKSSPGHDLVLKEFNNICVYTAENTSVAFLSK